ncbi:glycosyltransferase family 4 protein [Providencia huaxiensis]|uniref:glycosyltransferase family 4 protein n=1 Tax=Providencia TaxID=586 RepID=UPI002448E54C|nr:glycosyltransferase family 4 protein [Providencia rettgeri]ELR5058918.1 glycosyltransferase family 4 protein [Providencia rettgeri]ELR5088327.1 glycosyltransferase family 4 protein [Providencia rettgeri]MDH2324485.1 glycosyltransferase family 4 protein [Providencia rettgeri]
MIAITANTSWYIYNFRQNTIKALITAGYDVVAIAPKDDYSSRLESLGCKFIHLSIDQGGKNPFNDIKTLFQFYRLFKVNSIKCVLNFPPKNNIYATLAASFLKIKTINNIAGLGTLFIEENLSSKIARILYKLSQKRASKIFFQNEEDRSLFLKGGFAPENKTERLPGSGVDLTRFNISPASDDGVVRFLLIARMLYDKGVGHYVEAARELKQKYKQNVEFYLLGFLGVNNPSAITELEMKTWVDEGVVIYLGTSDSVEKEIAKVDCMVLPSFYREGVPKSLLESGAMGKPIVTTDNVGCRETVDHGINGFLCQPRSTESLVFSLEKIILMTHEQRLKMGLASREKMACEFNEQIIIDKYLQTIHSLSPQKK